MSARGRRTRILRAVARQARRDGWHRWELPAAIRQEARKRGLDPSPDEVRAAAREASAVVLPGDWHGLRP